MSQGTEPPKSAQKVRKEKLDAVAAAIQEAADQKHGPGFKVVSTGKGLLIQKPKK